MKIIVQKFGGTSVANLDRIRNVANLVNSEINNGNKVIVVVSAMAGVTNSLITHCNNLSLLDIKENMQEYDSALASGEIVTASLLALTLQKSGIKSKSMQGWQVPIETDDVHGNAKVINLNPEKILNLLESGITPVITGFQGVSDTGNITTLGKGGSDTSAAIIAASVKAERCDIYTDVEGIYNADPRIVHNATRLDRVDVDELCIMCSSGAKILHPRAALAIKRYGFTCRILSSFSSSSGTIIETKTKSNIMEKRLITAITSNKNLLKIDINYNANNYSQILKYFANNEIVISQTYNLNEKNAVIITNLTDKNKCKKLLEELKSNKIIINYDFSVDISTVTIVGYGINNDKNIALEIFEIINKNNIQIISSDLSDLKLSILINECDNEKLVKLLHKSFDEQKFFT